MRLKIILVFGIILTVILFGVMVFLMRTVNPQPLESENVTTESNEVDEIEEDWKSKKFRSLWDDDTLIQPLPPRIRNTTPKIVVPPVWPSSPSSQSPPLINEEKRNTQYNISNITEAQDKSSTPKPSENNTQGDTLLSKRSISDNGSEGDLNSIILKILDVSGKFNIEIKIGSKDAKSEKNVNTAENRSNSDTPTYSMSLKTKNNDQFKVIKLAKNIVISVMPNDSVTVNESDDMNVLAETEVKNNVTQANMVDIDIIPKSDVARNKYTVTSCKDVYKPVVIFHNQTKLIYNSDTKAKDIGKEEFLKEANNTSHPKQTKTNLNSLKIANNTDYIMQAEKNTFENDTIRLENATEMDNPTVPTNMFQYKTSTTENVNLEISLAKDNSQNDTHNLMKIEEPEHNHQLKFTSMGR